MSSIVTLKAAGLQISPNQLDLQPGSLSDATNVIIKRDNVIESRRGYKLYGNSMGSSTERAKQLIGYKNRIIRHYSDILEFDTGTVDNDGVAIFSPFSGSFLEAQTGLRTKSIEANGNLYLTSSEGIKKISALTASDFSTSPGYVTLAGGVKAVDLTTKIHTTPGDQSSWFIQDSAVAYRVVWGIKDLNNNLILGTPSQRSVIFNPLLSLLLNDFTILLGALDEVSNDGVSLISDGDYVDTLKLPPAASATDLQSSLIVLTDKIDNDILYANDSGIGVPLKILSGSISTGVATITFDAGDLPENYFFAGSKIFLAGFTTSTGTINGAQVVSTSSNAGPTITFNTTATGTVTVTGATIVDNTYRSITQPAVPSTPATDAELVALQTYVSDIITQLQNENSFTISTTSQTNFITPLAITTTATVILTITIPQDITTDYFVQIYRSDLAIATGPSVLSDVIPNDELKLVYEAFPTAAELAAHIMVVEDITPDAFRGANLYTNPVTGEGILQANDLPPFALDINRFKNVIFYANTKTRHRMSLNLLGVSKMITDYDNGIIPTITIINGSGTQTYRFIEGVAEVQTITTNAGGTLVNTANPASYWLLNSANNTDLYYVWYQIGSSTDPMISGRVGIEVVALAGDTAIEIAEKTRDAISLVLFDFSATSLTNVVTVYNNDVGYTDVAKDGTSGFAFSVITQGQGEKVSQEIDTFTTVADVAGSLAGKYFTINTAFNLQQNYVWFKVNGVGIDPAPANKVGILVNLTTNDSASTVATKIADVLNATNNYDTTAVGNTLTITNHAFGPANDATVATSGFSLTITQQGALDVLLSTLASASRAVDETARSLVHVINLNLTEVVYAYYLSGSQDVPGKILLEGRSLNVSKFYVLGNNSDTGVSFSPDISPTIFINGISAANPTVITTSTPHGLINKDQIVITKSNSTPSIDGLWEITYISPTTFSIPISVTNAGTDGSLINAVSAQFSQDEEKRNRIYYSKFLQPEAVPLVNTIDVGATDKAILRIFPLRDTLFVLKEDGLFRISGEVAPFPLSLFDTSCILLAPDSVSVSNNVIYAWTQQGISAITESGVIPSVTRPIDTDILRIASSDFTNFKTATWGLGYESDNSYTVFTTKNTNDTVATIAYRYSNLTSSWTTFDKTDTCGIVNFADDKEYFGCGDRNFIEQERKNFTRLDYADREINSTIDPNNYLGNVIKLSSVSDLTLGDVLVQNQTLTIYTFNRLLDKLDLDPTVGIAPITSISTGTIVTIVTSLPHNITNGEYVTITLSNSTPSIDGTYQITYISSTSFSIIVTNTITIAGTIGNAKLNYGLTLKASGGDNLRNKVVDLANKLDGDPGVVNTNYFSTIDTKTGAITSISATNPSVITSASHGLISGRIVDLTSTNSVPTINNTYQVTVLNANTFTIPTVVTTPGTSGTFLTQNDSFGDIKACYNFIITNLNSDAGVAFSNYQIIMNDTTLETSIINIDPNTKRITLSDTLDFVLGDIIFFKAIKSTFIYAPITMGDPIGLKHLREATIMFANKAFTRAIMEVASDLLPLFQQIPIPGDGNGIFGFGLFGAGFFGGNSNGAPFRTYIPRDKQRCRYILMKYTHQIAREKYAIYGTTITGEISLSSRAYR